MVRFERHYHLGKLFLGPDSKRIFIERVIGIHQNGPFFPLRQTATQAKPQIRAIPVANPAKKSFIAHPKIFF